MICSHPNLDADFKATVQTGNFYVCFRAWCAECFTDFEVTDDVQVSMDKRQMMVRIQSVPGIVAHLSMREH